MTIALEVASSFAGGTAGGTTAAINTSATTNPVNCIVLAVTSFSTGGYTVSGKIGGSSDGNTYTGLTLRLGTSFNAAAQLFYCLSPAVGSSHTFTVSGASTFSNIAALAFSGVGAFGAESGSGVGTSSTIQPGSLTPSASGSVLVTCASGGATSSINLGFTQDINDGGTASVREAMGLAHLVQSVAAAINPTWTWSASQSSSSAAMAYFTPSAGGGSTQSLFRQTLLNGIGSGGPFFNNPLGRSMLGWRPKLVTA